MALPNPLPDNPLKWDGWRHYNSPNLYARLGLDYSSNANAETIEDNCRQLLIWWQKKLPLKNQPSNPIAQLLRQGLDEAPQYLAEARTKLLDATERGQIDIVLHAEVIAKAIEEFKKLFTFIGDTLTEETETRLFSAGERLGLSKEEMTPVLEAEIERTGIKRVATVVAPPPPPVPEVPAPSGEDSVTEANGAQICGTPSSSGPSAASDPFEDFRRLLRMSRLCLDGDEMSDDQRDAMCNLGESLGLSGAQAEDLIDEYLEDAAAGMVHAPAAPRSVAAQATPVRPPIPQRPAPTTSSAAVAGARPAPAPAKPATPPPGSASTVGTKKVVRVINLSPAARAAERKKYTNFVNGAGMEMFLIPSGKFEMGSASPAAQMNEQPVTLVTLSCYYISRFTVTNAQYEKFDPTHKNKRAPWADDNHPVVFVSCKEAEEFCRWLSRKDGKNFRLPTEPEWEYAARGEDGRSYPWGEKLSAGNLANFADARSNFVWRELAIDDGFAETSPVGMYPRGSSPFGVEEMAGNVYEWCLDGYEPYRGRELVNPPPNRFGANRVLRGGSWKCRAASLRSTARHSNAPNAFSNDIGFRVMCECDPGA